MRNGTAWCGVLGGLLGAAALCDSRLAEWLALGLILAAGVPHGAFDLRLARVKWRALSAGPLASAAAYLAIGTGMSLLCLWAPVAGLSLFLGLSLLHFAEGELQGTRPETAAIFALAAVFLPVAFHAEAASGYLSYFGGRELVPGAEAVLRLVGSALWGAALLLVAREWRQGRRTETVQRLICLGAWLALPPLAGFAVWFIGRHSRQHLLACRALFRQGPLPAPRDFVVLSVLALLLLTPLLLRFDPRDINQLFAASIILVAGLTLPHMIVTHRLPRTLAALAERSAVRG